MSESVPEEEGAGANQSPGDEPQSVRDEWDRMARKELEGGQ